jgi:NitT/TauT family transport system substrate-binding protein
MSYKPFHLFLKPLLVLISIIYCSISHSQTLRIGTTLWPGYEPFYLAKEIKAYKSDIRMITYPSASEVLRAFKSRTLEAAALTLDEVLFLVESNIPIEIILVCDISEGADVIMGRPELKNMQGLIGASIAVESTAVGAYTLSRALELHNIGIDQISLVNVEHSDHKNTYKQGVTDAVVTYEPVRTQLLNEGAIELFNSKEIPGEIVDVLVVHKSTLDTHQTELNDIVEGWFMALDYLNDQPAASYEFIASRMKVSIEEAQESYFGLTLPSLSKNKEFLTGDSALLKKTLKNLSEHMIRSKLINPDRSAKTVFNSSFLP